jgi:pimeloyl-ACP methyl ester carboxylesterase
VPSTHSFREEMLMSSANALTRLVLDVGTELREGYAEVGDDVRFHYVEAGDGPLVVLLHGFPELLQDFLHDAQLAYTPEEMERYVEAWSQPGAATGMINSYRFAVRHSSGEIRPVTAPTLVIWGRERPATSARRSPSPTTRTCPTSTASSGCPMPRNGSNTTRPSASMSC